MCKCSVTKCLNNFLLKCQTTVMKIPFLWTEGRLQTPSGCWEFFDLLPPIFYLHHLYKRTLEGSAKAFCLRIRLHCRKCTVRWLFLTPNKISKSPCKLQQSNPGHTALLSCHLSIRKCLCSALFLWAKPHSCCILFPPPKYSQFLYALKVFQARDPSFTTLWGLGHASAQSWCFVKHFSHVSPAVGLILQILCNPIGNLYLREKTKQNIITERTPQSVLYTLPRPAVSLNTPFI